MPFFSRNTRTSSTSTPRVSPDLSAEKSVNDQEVKKATKKPGPLSFAGLHKFTSSNEKSALPSPSLPSKQHSAPVPGQAFDLGNPRADASRLSQFSLHLNELVNKAFVASNASSASQVPLTCNSPFTGASITIPRLQNIAYGNNRLPDRLKIIELTRLFIQELHNALEVDPYLLRAVSRAIVKSISQFVTRIESLMVSVTRDPGALVIPASVKAAHHLPPAMEFNLALVSLEWIVEESLERCLNGLPPLALLSSPDILIPTSSEGEAAPSMPGYVHEILSPLREQMEASIVHIIQPVLAQIKFSLANFIHKSNPRPFQPQRFAGSKQEAPIDASQKPGATSSWVKELEERLDAAYRILYLRISERCGQDGQAWFISVAIHVIWKGLVAITSRSVFAPASVVEEQFAHTFGRTSGTLPSNAVLNSLLSGDWSNTRKVPTPTQLAHALRSMGRTSTQRTKKMPGESQTGYQTPVDNCQQCEMDGLKSLFMLPNDQSDCFVIHPLLVAEQLHDLQIFERLMTQFSSDLLVPLKARKTRRSASRQRRASGESDGFADSMSNSQNTPVSSPLLSATPDDLEPRSPHNDDDDDLARAALKEALAALQSTVVVLRTLLQEPDTLQHFAMHARNHGLSGGHFLSPTAAHAFNVIPELLLIHIAFCRIPPGWTQRDSADDQQQRGRTDLLPSPPQLFGYSWDEYDLNLTGFAAGEVAASSLARLYLPVIANMYRELDEECQDAHSNAVNRAHESIEDDRSSQYSDLSDNEVSHMMQSAPALENTKAYERGRSSRVVSGTMGETTDKAGVMRSRSMHRSGQHGRFWRRNIASSDTMQPFHLPHALPPRVSRANAVSSPYRALSRNHRRSPSSQSGSFLPWTATHTLAHMQRDALNMFDSVLQRVGLTYRSVSP
ncbi:hypothetical protein MYAM1_000881 [Malassezia yamatoensis]|uniref:Uncharacterized protein n=1 Tax=Malassezia yamatoensis TaxID=253288 RepID=A0AAJ6CFC0_9BASI|nr:hypothetical protein MYAM1_000881 [Malassezia yamatoensis]